MNRLRDQIRIFESVDLISDWSCTGQSVRHDEKSFARRRARAVRARSVAHAFCIQAHSSTPLYVDYTGYTTCVTHSSTGALRAHRVIFMICVLHVSNALRPVTTRCGNTNLSPPFRHQDRQSVIPRGRELRARPMIQVHVAIAIRQLQAFHEKLSRSRPPSPSRLVSQSRLLVIIPAKAHEGGVANCER